MFNFWNVLFMVFSLLLVILLFVFKSPLKALFISELNWVILIVNSVVFASLNNDPRYFLFTFTFLFLAALEIVLYLFNFTHKNNRCLN